MTLAPLLAARNEGFIASPFVYLILKVSKVAGILSILFIVAGLALIAAPLLSLEGISVQLPQSYTSNGMTSFTVPVTAVNRGLLPLNGLAISLNIYEQNGTLIGTGGSLPTDVQAGSSTPISVQVLLVESKLLGQGEYLMTESQNLTADVQASLQLLNIMPVTVTTSTVIPWGAPLSGLTVGQPAIVQITGEGMTLAYPISFTDRSSFLPVQGNLTAAVYNGSTRIGSGGLPIDVAPGQPAAGLKALVTIQDPQIGSLLFENATLGYQLGFTFSNGLQAQILSSSYSWGAPVADLSAMGPVAEDINSSFVQFTVPVTFYDHSSVPMNFNMSASTVINGTTVRSQQVQITTVAGVNTASFNFIVPASAQPPSSINITVSTGSLSVSRALGVG